tara:strand:+ start:66 stop:743 length:678 start_codon:yes stop_codon:yes gene_type:complete
MNWEGEGYLLSKRKFRENANIINVFSQSKGKVSGVVYGGNSRKIRNFLQISNKLFIIHTSKSEDKLGYFKTELVKPISPMYFNDKERSTALISICYMLNILLPESQPNKTIYKSFEDFVSSINLEEWIILYILFELKLLKDLGYDPNLSKLNIGDSNIDIKKIKIDTFTYEVPDFLIRGEIPKKISNQQIKKSLYFTRSLIQNKFFIPNNLPFPKMRVLLENYYN